MQVYQGLGSLPSPIDGRGNTLVGVAGVGFAKAKTSRATLRDHRLQSLIAQVELTIFW